VVNTTFIPFYPLERPRIRCREGGWVGPSAGLDGCGISRPQRDSTPRTVKTVASRVVRSGDQAEGWIKVVRVQRSTETRFYLLTHPNRRITVRFPTGEKLCFPKRPNRLWGPRSLLLGALSPGVKRMGCATDYSPPSSVEVKNGGSFSFGPR